jgi:hypothetical protein
LDKILLLLILFRLEKKYDNLQLLHLLQKHHLLLLQPQLNNPLTPLLMLPLNFLKQ